MAPAAARGDQQKLHTFRKQPEKQAGLAHLIPCSVQRERGVCDAVHHPPGNGSKACCVVLLDLDHFSSLCTGRCSGGSHYTIGEQRTRYSSALSKPRTTSAMNPFLSGTMMRCMLAPTGMMCTSTLFAFFRTIGRRIALPGAAPLLCKCRQHTSG